MPKATALRFFYILHYPLTRIWAFFYFRSQARVNRHNLRQKEAMLIACNHQNAFLDGFVIAPDFDDQIRILTRADVFKHPIGGRFLRSHGLIPIYRERDGRDALEKNTEVFAETTAILSEAGKVLIFPEANCIVEKRMRPIRKGTARMAWTAAQNLPPDRRMWLLPTGITYSSHTGLRPLLHISYGKPIDVTALLRTDETNARALVQITRTLENEIRKQTIDYPVGFDAATFDFLLEIVSQDLCGIPDWSVSRNKEIYNTQQRLLAGLRNLSTTDLETVTSEAGALKHALQELKLPTEALCEHPSVRAKFRFAALLLTSPLALAGLITIKPIYSLAQWVVDKTVKETQFIASVRFAIGMFTQFPWWGLLSLITGYFAGLTAGLIALPTVMAVSWLALHWYDQWKAVSAVRRFAKSVKNGNPVALRALEIKKRLRGLLTW
jgi:1-acyl-sn-glycerol-3-phosphate acyltransferase